MLVTGEEMQRLEREAFSRGVVAADLMDEAGRGLAEVVRQFHPIPGCCVVFCGKGNNGGDALVAARHLRDWGWEILVDLAFVPEALGELPRRHYDALKDHLSTRITRGRTLVALDGLLGLGAKGEPHGEVATAIHRLNRLRRENSAWVLAIDLPSGLDSDTGIPSSCCVQADVTATIAVPKIGLVNDLAADFVGRLAVILLPALKLPESKGWQLSSPTELRGWLPPRPFDLHKGMAGRVGIVAGSLGLTGAAYLASAAAVKAGAGLVTLYVKPETYPLLATTCIPEVMVKEVRNYREILDEPMDVLAVGPGLGRAGGEEALVLVRDAEQPLVADADALNAIAADPALLRHCRGPRLLTPHPGEMQRLIPRQDRARAQWLDDFLKEYPVHLLLKGSRTALGSANGLRFYNTTGNPGMATGGMGDTLTGVCAALTMPCGGATAEALFRSAVLGAWLCGRAAEAAVAQPTGSPESLSATDIPFFLGAAFRGLRSGY